MNNEGDQNRNEKKVSKEYETNDLIVYWYPQECSHSRKCWQTLPQVFDPDKKPWITLDKATAEEIIKTIDKCPSEALKYKVKDGSKVNPTLRRGPGSTEYQVEPTEFIEIKTVKNGPLVVKGAAKIFDPDGKLNRESNHIVLCACGKSGNKPFCDGSHAK